MRCALVALGEEATSPESSSVLHRLFHLSLCALLLPFLSPQILASSYPPRSGYTSSDPCLVLLASSVRLLRLLLLTLCLLPSKLELANSASSLLVPVLLLHLSCPCSALHVGSPQHLSPFFLSSSVGVGASSMCLPCMLLALLLPISRGSVCHDGATPHSVLLDAELLVSTSFHPCIPSSYLHPHASHRSRRTPASPAMGAGPLGVDLTGLWSLLGCILELVRVTLVSTLGCRGVVSWVAVWAPQVHTA